MTAPSVLITGAGGFTGLHACRHFLGMGYRVTAVVRKEPERLAAVLAPELTGGAGRSAGTGVAEADAMNRLRIEVCDLMDYPGVKALMERVKPDSILHLAGRNSVPESRRFPAEYWNANVQGTLHVLEASREAGVTGGILVVGSMLSFTPGPSPVPPHPYSLSKTVQVLLARSWAHLFDLRVMAAEPSNLIGPGPTNGICGLLARKIVRWEAGADRDPFRLSSVMEKRDYLDVRDACAAYGAILEQGAPGELYRFGSGVYRTLGEVLETYRSITGRELPVVIGGSGGGPEPKPIAMRTVLRLGWRPVIPFEQSLRDVLEYFRRTGGEEE